MSKPVEERQTVPMSLVASGTETGGQVEGVKELMRKFEDNEAMIITDLYEKHFRPKSELGDNDDEDDKEKKSLSDFDAFFEQNKHIIEEEQ